MSTRSQASYERTAEIILERPLAEWIAEKRDAVPRWSWRLLAVHLARDTDGQVDVSYEALRSWYGDREHIAS